MPDCVKSGIGKEHRSPGPTGEALAQHRQIDFLQLPQQIERQTSEHLMVYLILDNCGTHNQPKALQSLEAHRHYWFHLTPMGLLAKPSGTTHCRACGSGYGKGSSRACASCRKPPTTTCSLIITKLADLFDWQPYRRLFGKVRHYKKRQLQDTRYSLIPTGRISGARST